MRKSEGKNDCFSPSPPPPCLCLVEPHEAVRFHRGAQGEEVASEEDEHEPGDCGEQLVRMIRLQKQPHVLQVGDRGEKIRLGEVDEVTHGDQRGRGFVAVRADELRGFDGHGVYLRGRHLRGRLLRGRGGLLRGSIVRGEWWLF